MGQRLELGLQEVSVKRRQENGKELENVLTDERGDTEQDVHLSTRDVFVRCDFFLVVLHEVGILQFMSKT